MADSHVGTYGNSAAQLGCGPGFWTGQSVD